MNKIVRENYPVEKLPEDIRKELQGTGPVKVLVEQEEPAGGSAIAPSETGHFTRWKERRRADFSSAEEIDAHIRALRDEWDRR